MDKNMVPLCRRMEWLDPFYKAVWEKAFAEAIPISGTFELTPRCNFDCRMCYVHLKSEEISRYGKEQTAEQWINMAKEAKEAGTTWLCVTGGEPLVHPEFDIIWKALSQMGFFITLQTNGALLEGKILNLLAEYPPKLVKMSLYGSNDQVYQKVCQVSEGFTKVDRGIQALKEMKIPIELVSTIIKQNVEDIPGMIRYAFLNKLRWINTVGIKPSVRGRENHAKELEIQNRQTEEAFKDSLKNRIKKHSMSLDRKPCTMCKDYRLGYWITWNGNIQFCGFMNRPEISVKELGFQEAWKQLLEYEESLRWPDKCYTCKVQEGCLRCAGILSAECGGPEEVTEEFCNKVKQYYDEEAERWMI